MKVYRPKSKKAFTLVELLAVLAIMVVLGGIIGVAIREPSGSQSLRAANSVMMSVFRNARTVAISNNARTRVIIHADNSEPEKFLRYVGIVYETEINGNTGWVAADKGIFLPEKIYYVPESNVPGISSGNSGRNKVKVKSKLVEETRLRDFPQTVIMPETGTRWFYYEFNDNGTIEPSQKNSSVVLTTGTTIYEGSSASVSFTADEYTVEGFAIRPTGLTTRFMDFSDVENF